MRKLIDVKCKGFPNTVGESLENVIENCNRYKNEEGAIDNPDALDEVWNKIRECPAIIDDAHALYRWINEWLDINHLAYTSMLGFSFRPILGNIGLAISQMTMENSEEK